MILGFASAQAPGPGGPGGIALPKPGADGAYAGDNYFQYINVPAPHTFEWGYRRGNDGHEGPVYTIVKTEPQANFKWGVRHRAGAQYGKVCSVHFSDNSLL